MIQNVRNTNVLLDYDQLEELLGALDLIHTVVSEDLVAFHTPMERRDLIAILREIAFTVDETIHELELTAPCMVYQLHIVEKPSA